MKERVAQIRAEYESRKAPAQGAQGLAPIIQLPTAAESQEGSKVPAMAQAQLDQIGKEVQPADAATRGAQVLQALAAKLIPFMDQNGQPHLMLDSGRRTEAVPLGSEVASDAVRDRALQDSGRPVTKDGLETLRSMLRTVARSQPPRTVYQRVGMDGADHLLDLGDPDGQMARASATGVTVEKNDTIPFRRGRGYGALPMPAACSDAAQAWESVEPMVENVPDADKLPVVTDRHKGAGHDRRNGATWRGLKVAFRTVRRMG